jgi:hypothetical protein
LLREYMLKKSSMPLFFKEEQILLILADFLKVIAYYLGVT